MVNQLLLREQAAPGRLSLDAIKCTLIALQRAWSWFVAGMGQMVVCLWRKLSFTWDLDFSNLPTGDCIMLPTAKLTRNTMNETLPCLLDAFFAYQSKNSRRRTAIFTLDWENAWRWQSGGQMMLVLRRDKSRADITDPSHSYYYLLTARQIGKVLIVEVLYTDDKVTGWMIDRDVFSESEKLRDLTLRARAKKHPPGKKFNLKVDNSTMCGTVKV
jgi:hypothetical protein